MSTAYLPNCKMPRSFESERVAEKDFLLEERSEQFPEFGGSAIFKCRNPKLRVIMSV
jgi:hypothetical protein